MTKRSQPVIPRPTAGKTSHEVVTSSSPLAILLVFSACVHLSAQLPASARSSESAGSILERDVRQATRGGAVNASKFILDVYNSVANKRTPVNDQPNPNQPNIIRYIDYLKGSSCDEFVFDLSSINGREIVYQVDLRITFLLDGKLNGVWPALYVIQASDLGTIDAKNFITNTSGNRFSLVASFYAASAGWVNDLESTKKGFKVLFYNTQSDFSDNKPINICGGALPIKVVYNSKDDSPALVVYSRDPDATRVAAQALLKGLSGAAFRRGVRQATGASTSACGVGSLYFTANMLNGIPLLYNQTIVYPSTVDSGICGGQCYSEFPDSLSPVNLLIAHYVIRTAANAASYKQCCAPIQYSALSFLSVPAGSGSGTTTTVTTLDNMKVSRCSCMDITA